MWRNDTTTPPLESPSCLHRLLCQQVVWRSDATAPLCPGTAFADLLLISLGQQCLLMIYLFASSGCCLLCCALALRSDTAVLKPLTQLPLPCCWSLALYPCYLAADLLRVLFVVPSFEVQEWHDSAEGLTRQPCCLLMVSVTVQNSIVTDLPTFAVCGLLSMF